LPVECFYIALYNEENDEVSFPLVIERDQQVKWSSRRHSQGLTEHIIRTRSPLLSRESFAVTRSKLGVNRTKRPATSWLGVPIIAGDELLGVIAVQSFSSSDLYDLTHQAVVNTIASQAAVAIQNSRIYTRTDSARKSRVQELDSILRTIEEGVLLVDLKFKVLTVNRTLAGIVGTTRDELKGISIIDFMLDGNRPLIDSIGYTKNNLLDDCEDILSREYEIKRQTFSLSTRSDKRIERTLTPVRDLEEKITAWLFVFRDVTEEFELMRLREDMMHTLIHDLRSPLAVVKGSLEVIKLAEAEGHQENIDELLRLALIGTERMLRLINNLLDASRLEEGKMIMDPHWVSIKPLVENAFRQVAAEANRVNITIEVSADEDLPSILVDQGHLERVLNNLLDNAIKFTPDGGRIDLYARIEPDYSPASIIIGVNDTGPGIPEEIQSQLFKKFKQLGMIQGRRTGSGIGLHYCKLAIEAHGGQIWVESQVGRGSTFFIQLPIAP
jgi:PAS domain S-box-containing protein